MPIKWYQRPDDNLPQRRAWPRPPTLALLLALAALVLTYRWWLAGLARALMVDEPPVQADMILVLGGGDGPRQERAIALYEEGFAPLIISSGEKPLLPDFERTFAELGADYMAARGVPREAILLLPETTSTRDEALASLELARAQGYSSLLVVTDAFHAGRSRLTFRRAFRGSGIRVTFVSAYPAWFNPDTWWTGERSLMAVMEEYEKLVYYLVRGYLV